MIKQLENASNPITLRPQPYWFTTGKHQCFAMLHLPASQPSRGVVIVNGVGFDGLLAYRTLRVLATQLATQGLAVIRFDLPGTGDSSGDYATPNQVNSWVTSVEDACGVLHDLAGVSDIQLLGFRMGASLALLAAEQMNGVSGISMWAPTPKGRAFVREMHALNSFRDATRPTQPSAPANGLEPELEVVGFQFTAATLDDLSSINVNDPRPTCATPHAFILDRSDAPRSQKLATALNDVGVVVDHDVFDDYQSFMIDDETKAVLPQAAIDKLVTWHCTSPLSPIDVDSNAEVATTLILTPSVDQFSRDHVRVGMPRHAIVESATWIDTELLAIVTRPEADQHRNGTCVVVSNTGTVNRSGPGRFHTPLARHWASLGYTVIRVDLGGSGDSAPRDPTTENTPYSPERIRELNAVVAYARTEMGMDQTVAFGICSGAYNNLQVAASGAPLDAIVLVNPLIFSIDGAGSVDTSLDRAVLSANRLSVGLANRSWHDVRVRHGGAIGAARRARALVHDGAVRGYAQMLNAKLRDRATRVGLTRFALPTPVDTFRRLHHNDVRVVLAFADEEPGERYLRTIGGSAFRDAIHDGSVHVINIVGGDHIFSPPAARLELTRELTNWLTSNFPEPSESRRVTKVSAGNGGTHIASPS